MSGFTNAGIKAIKATYLKAGIYSTVWQHGVSKGTVYRMKKGGWTLDGYKAVVAEEAAQRRAKKAAAAPAKTQPEIDFEKEAGANGIKVKTSVKKGQPETVDGVHHHIINQSQQIEVTIEAQVLGKVIARNVVSGIVSAACWIAAGYLVAQIVWWAIFIR